MKLEVRYGTLSGSFQVFGVGQTLNVSSNGLLVDSRNELSEGVRLEVTLVWPCLLDGTAPLQLVALAKVVRCAKSIFAATFVQHQFRTAKIAGSE